MAVTEYRLLNVKLIALLRRSPSDETRMELQQTSYQTLIMLERKLDFVESATTA